MVEGGGRGDIHRRGAKLFIDLVKYALIPAIGVLSPLFVIPAITRNFGAEGWAALAIAQAIGNGTALFAGLGWSVIGPQQIASHTFPEALGIYRLALTSRLAVIGPIGIITGMVSWFAVQSYEGESAIIAVGVMGAALTPQWFFIGLNRPLTILLTDGAPRLAAALGSALAIDAGAPLVVFPIATLLCVPLTLLLTALALGPGSIPRAEDWSGVVRVIREQAVVAWGRSISIMFTSAPVVVVGLVSPQASPLFSAADRLLRMSVMVLRSVPSRLQSWIGAQSASGASPRARVVRALQIQIAMGIVAGVGFTLLAPPVSSYVFSGEVGIPLLTATLSGVLVAMICVGAGLGLGLVAFQRANAITAAIIVGAVVALVAVPLGSMIAAADGGLLGVIAAETSCEIVQAVVLYRVMREPRRR
ncbi:hypothetical protein GSU68_11275 [Rathayibacter sp. VKM Ac-2759]|uniref:lipopolysaccharide biosynthesis protein n=1 Tax=Rathayibacter sp. VKM Ac-2759 TaxID=2609252 RepID=UPI001315EA49|nr:hypothetical protein [Rathayibacter sp. VKM Ac-2759]QHC67086.1 hypothetical protein GSU68_11275 [Rathayibacter sp. VKM Ac-2759]